MTATKMTMIPYYVTTDCKTTPKFVVSRKIKILTFIPFHSYSFKYRFQLSLAYSSKVIPLYPEDI